MLWQQTPRDQNVFMLANVEQKCRCSLQYVTDSATDLKAPVGFAGIPIGLVLTLIHLVGIPVTNTSVNPARSIGPALFVGGWALAQLWLFIFAPFLG
jgi:glycerol uptake facilitator-like aquaporin